MIQLTKLINELESDTKLLNESLLTKLPLNVLKKYAPKHHNSPQEAHQAGIAAGKHLFDMSQRDRELLDTIHSIVDLYHNSQLNESVHTSSLIKTFLLALLTTLSSCVAEVEMEPGTKDSFNSPYITTNWEHENSLKFPLVLKWKEKGTALHKLFYTQDQLKTYFYKEFRNANPQILKTFRFYTETGEEINTQAALQKFNLQKKI